MKAKVTRDLAAVPSWNSPLIKTIEVDDDGVLVLRRIVPAGTVIDQHEHPETNVVMLIRNGEAVPVDDEARTACGMTAAAIEAAQKAVDRMQSVEEEQE